MRLPKGQFVPRKQIVRVGECRRPPSVQQPRVPTDVVDVQVGTQNDVDLLGPEPGRAQIGQIRVVLVVITALLRTMLVVTAAGVDQDRVPRRPDDEGMEGENQVAARPIE